jgi:arylsulfatase A-like enzyme
MLRAVLSCMLVCSSIAAQRERANIVFVLADDLGWTDLSTGRTNRGNGSDYYRTPNLDALASRGVSFDNAYTCGPNCAPSRAALFSGLHAARTGVYTVFGTPPDANRRLDPAPSRSYLPAELGTLAERVRAEGYATGHFGKWHLGDDPGYGPLYQGFDCNVGGTGAGNVTGGSSGHFALGDGSFDLPGLGANGIPFQFMADRLTDEAIAWMAANSQQPFLCWIAHFSVHVPIQAPAADIAAFDGVPPGRHHRDQTYAGMLKNLDDGVGRIVRFLEDTDDPRQPGAKLIANTVVIFTSDNGGLGGYASAGIAGGTEVTHQAPLRAGKGSLYEGGIRVPLIVRWDGRVAPGTVQSVPVQSVDFTDTLAHMAGAVLSEEPSFDGLDLVPLLRGAVSGLPRSSLFWHFPAFVVASAQLGTWIETPVSAIRRDDWKLRFAYETRTWELYDLGSDPGESVDRVGERTDVALALGAELREWLVRTQAALPRARGTGVPVALPGAPGAGDAVDWRLVPLAAAPPALDGAAAVGAAERICLFAGESAAGVSDALWEFDGQRWSEVSLASRPPARRDAAACWDSARAQLVVFGGADADAAALGDTWVFDGAAWRQPSAPSPPPRAAAALVFDAARGVAVLFGGQGAGGPLDDTWEFDGVVWQQRSLASAPPPRSGHAMVFDPIARRAVVFGGMGASGAPLADTWTYDGAAWQELAAANAPPARSRAVFVVDAARARAVLFGGRDADGLALADTWEFDGAAWRARAPAHPPLALIGAAAAFEPNAERVVLFGGRNGARFAATWDLAAADPASARVYGAGCAGSAGTPALAPIARPWLGGVFAAELAPLRDGGAAALLLGFSDALWGGVPLPLSLAIFGAPGCALWAAPEVTLPLAAAAGRATVRLAVPPSASLLGQSFFVQALAHDPAANALGLVASDAIAARIGAR